MAASKDRDTIFIGSPDKVLPALAAASGVTIYNGTLVAKDKTGVARPAAAAAGYIVWGVAIAPAVQANGDDVNCVRGYVKLDNSTGDPLAAADIGHWCYVEDDSTVCKTPGTYGRRAGIFLGLDADDSQAIVYVGDPQAQSDGSIAVDSPVTSGAISPDVGHTFVSTTGTTALTLADGSFPGQKVSLVEITAASTPHGVLTPATKTGFTSIEFNTIGDCAVLRWNGAAWFIDSQSGCTIV